jgi:hypothetical protein
MGDPILSPEPGFGQLTFSLYKVKILKKELGDFRILRYEFACQYYNKK